MKAIIILVIAALLFVSCENPTNSVKEEENTESMQEIQNLPADIDTANHPKYLQDIPANWEHKGE